MSLRSISTNFVFGIFVVAVTVVASVPEDASAGAWARRRELKNICKQEYVKCQNEKSKKACYADKKECRKENGVSFGDDIKFLFNEAKDLISKIGGVVKLARGEDENFGAYTKVTLTTSFFKFAPSFSITLPEVHSYVTIPESAEEKALEFYLYDSDLKLNNYVMKLQTSPGRTFPRFFDGRAFDFLTGVQFVGKSGKAYQFYLDSGYDVFGSFLPSKIVGEAIKVVNYGKNYIPYIGLLIPDVDTVPFTLKYEKVKVGRLTLLSQKSFEYSAGILVLFDRAVIAASF